jgi:hypothetical protein
MGIQEKTLRGTTYGDYHEGADNDHYLERNGQWYIRTTATFPREGEDFKWLPVEKPTTVLTPEIPLLVSSAPLKSDLDQATQLTEITAQEEQTKLKIYRESLKLKKIGYLDSNDPNYQRHGALLEALINRAKDCKTLEALSIEVQAWLKEESQIMGARVMHSEILTQPEDRIVYGQRRDEPSQIRNTIINILNDANKYFVTDQKKETIQSKKTGKETPLRNIPLAKLAHKALSMSPWRSHNESAKHLITAINAEEKKLEHLLLKLNKRQRALSISPFRHNRERAALLKGLINAIQNCSSREEASKKTSEWLERSTTIDGKTISNKMVLDSHQENIIRSSSSARTATQTQKVINALTTNAGDDSAPPERGASRNSQGSNC